MLLLLLLASSSSLLPLLVVVIAEAAVESDQLHLSIIIKQTAIGIESLHNDLRGTDQWTIKKKHPTGAI